MHPLEKDLWPARATGYQLQTQAGRAALTDQRVDDTEILVSYDELVVHRVRRLAGAVDALADPCRE